jgi:predicted dehydrogenase
MDERVLPRRAVSRRLRGTGAMVLCNPYIATHKRLFWCGRLEQKSIEAYMRRELGSGDEAFAAEAVELDEQRIKVGERLRQLLIPREASDSKDALLMMASKFRYVDDIIKAKAIIEAGILGRIILYENSFCSKINMADRWNSNKAVAGGGVLIDNGSHSADIARYLLGPIVQVQAQQGTAAQGLDVEDTVRVQFLTKSGVLGTFDLSWTITKDSKNYIQIYGSEGTLQVGWKGSRYCQDGSSKWIPFGSGYDKNKSFASQHSNFIDVLKGNDKPVITAEDSLASVQFVETAYRSAGTNHWLRIETP